MEHKNRELNAGKVRLFWKFYYWLEKVLGEKEKRNKI